MKKILLSLFRNIEQKNKQQLINELLTMDSTIEESISLFEKVKADFLYKISLKQEQILKEAALIERIKPALNDYEKPLSEIEITYTHVKP